MSDVIFNPGEMDYNSGGLYRSNVTGGFLVKLTRKLTGIDDETQINKILLALAGIFFAVAAIILVAYL